MLKTFLLTRRRALSHSPASLPAERQRAVTGSTIAGLAARFLIAPSALMQLTHDEAMVIVGYMTPRRIAMGTTFISQGDNRETGYMVLLLRGEVTVENLAVSRRGQHTVTVLAPGSLIGEISLVDGSARLASCTASTDVLCATLSRGALEQLTHDDPRTAAKLLLAVAVRIGSRLRETTDKVRLYSQLTQAMQQEIDALMPTPERHR